MTFGKTIIAHAEVFLCQLLLVKSRGSLVLAGNKTGALSNAHFKLALALFGSAKLRVSTLVSRDEQLSIQPQFLPQPAEEGLSALSTAV